MESSTISNLISKMAGPESVAEGSISDDLSNAGGSGNVGGKAS